MALSVKSWVARLKVSRGPLIYMPFDENFDAKKHNNRTRLSSVGQQANWHFFINFAGALDPADPSYPHFARVQDNADSALLTFNCKWSGSAGVQYGVPGSAGPIPTAVGEHKVRFELLNKDQQPIGLSQSGIYYIDAG